MASQIVSQKNWDNDGQVNEMNSFAGMQFSADVHQLGTLKGYKATGRQSANGPDARPRP